MNWIAVLQAVETLVIVGGIIFAVVQLREAKLNRQMTVVLNMFADFHQEVAYERRQRVLDSPPTTAFSGRDYLDRMQMADFYQRIGYLCRVGLLDQHHVLEMYAKAIERDWEALKPFVHMRRQDEDMAGYSRDFESLAEASAELSQSGSTN